MEHYTAQELLEIVEELGLPCQIIIDTEQDVLIQVGLDDIEWSIELGPESAFYHSVLLKAVDVSEDLPHPYVNAWNQDHITSAAYALHDSETNEPILLDNGLHIVVLRNSFPFFGSVTKEFIEFMFHCFHEDVCEFYGLTDDDEETEVSDNEVNPDHAPIPLLEQLQLELVLNPIQSARSLARSLGISKYEVNHLLYMHKELFEKEGTSPPLWANKGEINE